MDYKLALKISVQRCVVSYVSDTYYSSYCSSALGETWFGEDALERGLTDEIKTADQVLTEYVDGGWNVYEVEYKPPDENVLALAGLPGTSTSQGILGNAAKWLIQTLVQEVKSELGSGVDLQKQFPLEKRYMMIDDTSDRIRSEYN